MRLDEKDSDATKPTDFQPYLTAATTAAQRSRTLIYLIAAMCVFVVTTSCRMLRRTQADSRLATTQKAYYECRTNPPDQECLKSWREVKQIFPDFANFRTDSADNRAKTADVLWQTSESLFKQKVDALQLNVPFFGVVIDANDLGLISGAAFLSLLFLLWVSIKRETDVFERCQKQTKISRNKNNLELLLMAQVLFVSFREKEVFFVIINFLFSLPFLLYVGVWFADLRFFLNNFNGSLNLQDLLLDALVINMVVGMVFLVFIGILTVCVQKQWKILNNRIQDLELEINE